MCFSATASFVAGSVLTAAGLIAVSRNGRNNQLAFASMPLLFGVQQLSEGFLWLALTREEYAHWIDYPMFIFIVIAQTFWPAWVPWSIRALEVNVVRRKWMLPLVWIGVFVSVRNLISLLFLSEVTASVNGIHILYSFSDPINLPIISAVLYILAIVGPPLISSARHMKLLGVFIALALAVSAVYFKEVVISVWCYFAAAISAIVFLVLKYMPNKEKA